MEKNFRQVIYKMRAATRGDPVELGFLGWFEKNLIRLEPDAPGVEKSLQVQPAPGGGMKIVTGPAQGVRVL